MNLNEKLQLGFKVVALIALIYAAIQNRKADRALDDLEKSWLAR